MTRLFAALAVVVALLGIPAAAHAQDHRPCVSKREFYGTHGTMTKTQVEARWDVRGRRSGDLSGETLAGYVYPACGYSNDDGQVWAIYRRRSAQLYYDYRWIAAGTTPHGRP